MSVIAQRLWREPAVFIGLLTSVVLVVVALATDTDWDASVIAGIVAPFLSALGIRPLVSPAKAPSADA